MKTTASLLLTVAALVASTAHGDVVNRVTITGKIISATQPVVTQSATTTTTKSKLVSQGITNSSILDALVARDVIDDKKGYAIVELFSDEGVSQGLFVRNAKSGDTIEIDASFVSAPTDEDLVTADSSVEKTKGDTTTTTTSSAFTGIASSTVLGTTTSSFLTGTTASKSKSVRVEGVATAFPFLSTTYTAVSRGTTVDHTLIDAKLTSTGSTFEVAE